MPGPTGPTILQVDAFTREPFRGNPAAVCILVQGRDAAWMQAVAREMNLPQTAFLERGRDGAWSLRWFTPAVEVDLCGHATLAAAHALWEQGLAHPGEQLQFDTRSGRLTARREGSGIVLDFPSAPAQAQDPVPDVLKALGVAAPTAFARNRFDYLVQVSSASDVRAVVPDMTALAQIATRGVVVTAPADDGEHDFVSRWFGPRVGVAEDPVTGSSHCCLGPWWGRLLGKQDMRGAQLSARGGSVGVRLRGDRVELVGNAVTVLRGGLCV